MKYLSQEGLTYLWSKIKALIPTKVSDLQNDSNFITSASVPTAETTTPKMDGTESAGTSTKWSRGDHVHPSDSTKVDKIAGKGLSTKDYTAEDQTKLSGIAAGAEVNQNAYSTVKVGNTSVAAGAKQDTLTIAAGANVSVTANSSTKTVTISATNDTYGEATTETPGLMSAADKAKLDGIAEGANKYELPTAIPIANGGTGAGSPAEAMLNLMSRGIVTDANEVKDIGYYATTTNTTNLPFATYGTLTVYKSAQNWIIQIWTSSTSAESCMYMRKNINGEGFGSWHKLLGSDSPVSIAQGGTGGTKLEEAQKNILDGTYPGEGTDLSKLTPGIYCLPNDSNTIANVPAVSWSPLAFVFGHQNNDTAADGSPTGGYFQGYLNWEGELWLRRRKWSGWGNWLQIISSNGGEINGGALTISKTSGFNYSGMEEGTTGVFRNVWFSDAGAKGKPCYHSGLLYNPGTQDLSVGGHSVYHTGNIIYSSTQPSNVSAGTIWLKPV